MKFFVIFLLFCSNLPGQDLFVHLPAKITLHVEEQDAFEGNKLPLYIIVDHMKGDSVDIHSFRMNDQLVDVTLISSSVAGKANTISAENPKVLYTSRYKMFLPPRSSGIYTIGPLEARVGNVLVQSTPISIHIKEAVVTQSFTLESILEASSLYPGQKVHVTYLLSFPGSIQIVKEILPLLDLEGFLPLGSSRVQDFFLQDGRYQEKIEREFRASHPGSFTFGPSFIEGLRIVEREGKKILLPPLLRAKEEGKSLLVLPFPEKGKPSFFTGAIGAFTWRGRIIGSNRVTVEDTIEVEWRVSGRGDIDTVLFPSFEEDELFASRFVMTGQPREIKEDQATKSFRVFLRPKNVQVKEVPSFQFASFDPIIKEYVVSVPAPLALGVEEVPEDKKGRTVFSSTSLPTLLYDPLLYTSSEDIFSFSLERLWISFCVLLISAVLEQRSFSRKKTDRSKKAQDLFYKAYVKRGSTQEGLRLLREALLLRMYETGLIEKKDIALSELSQDGLVGQVRSILQSIDAHLYGNFSEKPPVAAIWKEASSIYHQMKQLKDKAYEYTF